MVKLADLEHVVTSVGNGRGHRHGHAASDLVRVRKWGWFLGWSGFWFVSGAGFGCIQFRKRCIVIAEYCCDIRTIKGRGADTAVAAAMAVARHPHESVLVSL